MNCRDARRALAEFDDPVVDGLPESLAAHIRGCPECARLRTEFSRTWRLLGEVWEVNLSEDFTGRVLARASAAPPVRGPWRIQPAWRWVAAAAALLLVAIPLLLRTRTVQTPLPLPEAVESAGTDASDNAFLQELEQSLDRVDRGYLSEYDTWPRDLVERPTGDREAPGKPAATPKAPEKGEQRHEGA